jgi:predicted transcriptional regulator
MENPPGYSAVRTMLNVLVQKGFLDYRREKTRYIYQPLLPEKKAQQSIFRNLLDTFFPGKPTAAVAALLDAAAGELSEEDYREMERLIKGHRESGIGHRA